MAAEFIADVTSPIEPQFLEHQVASAIKIRRNPDRVYHYYSLDGYKDDVLDESWKYYVRDLDPKVAQDAAVRHGNEILGRDRSSSRFIPDRFEVRFHDKRTEPGLYVVENLGLVSHKGDDVEVKRRELVYA